MAQHAGLMANAQIENKISVAVDSVVQQMASIFDDIGRAIVGKNTISHLVINNSFFAREKHIFKANQSAKRLVAELSAAGKKVSVGNISVCDDINIRNHYGFIPQKEAESLTPLGQAIVQELASMGDLIFILVGTMQGLRPYTQEVTVRPVSELRLVPSLTEPDIHRIGAGVYGIRKIVAPEDLIAFIEDDLQSAGGLSIECRRAIAEAYDKLTDAATTDVIIPRSAVQNPHETILEKTVASLREQAGEYRKAVEHFMELPDDSRRLNEILRLAYNFSSEAVPLVSLFTSICDLKPLVFWCTVKQHWALYRAFSDLPWSALGRKEKLGEYQAVVSSARSHAFHHVLPFDSTVEADLSTVDVRADKIRLFLPFKETKGRGVHLKDQQLVDVLAEFSRARLRPVSTAFWQANLKVMERACDLAQEILETLLLVRIAKTS
jgi:hypothetical protein